MTFDEALEAIKPYAVDEIGSGLTVMKRRDEFEIQNIINELRETYAPTIEMTEAQKNQLLAFKEVNSWFSVFIYKQSHGGVPAFSESITPDREDELIRAWLNPELIKVVD